MAVYGRSRAWAVPYQAPALVPAGNEPAGMTVITDRPYNALRELGWDESTNGQPDSNVTLMSDGTAPTSPSNILRVNYPAGMIGGGAPWDGDSPAFAYRTLYVAWWTKLSANWEGHPGSSVNKQFYCYTIGDVPSVYIDMHGASAGNLSLSVSGQNISAGGAGFGDPANPDWTPDVNPAAAVIARGQWFKGELLLVMNSVGATDGSIDWWLNGVKVGHVGSVQFQSTSPTWRSLHMAPVWGGGGGTVTNTMTMDWDHLYVSGK